MVSRQHVFTVIIRGCWQSAFPPAPADLLKSSLPVDTPHISIFVKQASRSFPKNMNFLDRVSSARISGTPFPGLPFQNRPLCPPHLEASLFPPHLSPATALFQLGLWLGAGGVPVGPAKQSCCVTAVALFQSDTATLSWSGLRTDRTRCSTPTAATCTTTSWTTRRGCQKPCRRSSVYFIS